MLYVTHDQVEAMTLGDRVAVLERGRLQQVAPPRELYARPANGFVAGFIGSPPMNFAPARWLPGGAPPAASSWRGVAARGGRRSADVGCARARSPATVVQVEALGHETLVHVRLACGRRGLIARVRGHVGRAHGESLRVTRRSRRAAPVRPDAASLALTSPRVALEQRRSRARRQRVGP